MRRIKPSMIAKGGKRYCRICRTLPDGLAQRIEAKWTHMGNDYCDEHKPKPTPISEHYSEADYQTWLRL